MSAAPSTPSKSPIKAATTSPTPSDPKPPTTINTTTAAPPPTTTSPETPSTSHSEPSITSHSSLSNSKPVTAFPPPKTSTKTSVESVEPTTSTRTSTITDHPESTFSSPVSVSVIDPNNGRVTLTTPPVVTVFSTSTEPNGEFVTFTHVVANPTGFSSEKQVSVTGGFLGNHGAVAGVFVVVGIFASAIGCCIVLVFRRRRRQSRRRRWLAGIQQPAPSNPFEDPSDSPQMRIINNNRQEVNWDGSAPFTFSGETRQVSLHSTTSQHDTDAATPFVGIGSGMSPRRVPVPSHHFVDNPNNNPGLGFGVGYGRAFGEDHRDRVSIAQSSPSIYPVSLPPSGDDDTTDATVSPTVENASDFSSRHIIVGAPPRPPRSHLRRSITKPSEMYPITPPTSVSSHAPSNPPSPILDQAKVISRRTLLDVRPRSGHESIAQGF
ncbi:hypothetical protein FPV67DRAFT_1689360 [Lyophyllum atratum]|nr:hypothetical protein FPV67DRAFT_1689360 [Lyophyllum atratum]